MSGAIPPLLQYAFMAWYLAKARENFTYYLLLLLPAAIRKNFMFTASENSVTRTIQRTANY
jgi:hypothetical protein